MWIYKTVKVEALVVYNSIQKAQVEIVIGMDLFVKVYAYSCMRCLLDPLSSVVLR